VALATRICSLTCFTTERVRAAVMGVKRCRSGAPRRH
jgi:hypothetical protein